MCSAEGAARGTGRVWQNGQLRERPSQEGMAMGRGHRRGVRLGPGVSDQVGTRRDYVMVLPGHAGVLVHVHLTHCTQVVTRVLYIYIYAHIYTHICVVCAQGIHYLLKPTRGSLFFRPGSPKAPIPMSKKNSSTNIIRVLQAA